ncbi:MAG: LAGLIDADG family homing endonuclease [Candidatus Paceibacterota bacterium]
MKANAVGKIFVEVDRAYLAGIIDGDGAIMATIERHREKKFGFRVRVEIKITQKEANVLNFLRKKFCVGRVVANRTTFDWIIRDQNDAKTMLNIISPYSLAKKRQIKMAILILNTHIGSKADLISVARLADTLSKFNVRSKGRRLNYASMIKTDISPND